MAFGLLYYLQWGKKCIVNTMSNNGELPTILVMLGATGDLAKRKLIPALAQLYTNDMLPPLFHVVGFARRELSDDEFREYVATIARDAGVPKKYLDAFSQLFSYRAGNFDNIEGYEDLAKFLGKQDDEWRTCANKLFYLAVPPQYYKNIFQHLAASGLTEPCSPEEGWTRVVVEKPFGKDLATAQELDEMLGHLFKEEQIYRIDHYLGKDTVQNILAFRFSNTFLDPAWDNRSVESIHIRFLEKDTAQGRASFYDGLGALRDVGQNHMLQMLALIAMENPGSFDAAFIRRERTRILEELEIMDADDVARQTVRGQYAGYVSSEGVKPASATETYFHLRTHIDSPRWRNVPMYLESGKAMDESKVEITVKFRHHTPCLCPPFDPAQGKPGKHYTNTLRYRIQPDEGMYMSFWVKKPGAQMVIEEKEFSFNYRQAYEENDFVDAYTKLLLNVISGDQTAFVSTAEILASWRFIDPIIEGWQKNAAPLVTYEQGSRGPTEKAVSDTAVVLPKKEIGYIGLGKMGSNMVSRLIDDGGRVVAYDPDEKARQAAAGRGAEVHDTIAAVAGALKAPRAVWIMVPHSVVDSVLAELVPHLQPGDVVIDGGNSFYKDSLRRAKELVEQGIHYLDVGVSGGPSGARAGACLMIGGPKEVYKRYEGLFASLAVAGGYDYMGASGAGHFVKMVHNGIEYGMMQAIAEGFAVIKQHPEGFDLTRIANLYNHGSVIESRLIEWLREAYQDYGPNLDEISGTVAHSGEGLWTVNTAKEFGIPVPIIEGALQFRVQSQDTPSYTGQILSALRNQFGGHEVKKRNS